MELTWDETNKDRIAVTMRKFNKDELDEMDLNDYLASDDDDAPGDVSLSRVNVTCHHHKKSSSFSTFSFN